MSRVKNYLLPFIFLPCILSVGSAVSQNVTQLKAFSRNGQVFITWQNLSDTLFFYNVYRSSIPITTSAQLEESEYLGYTNFESSKDHGLSRHDGTDVFFSLDSGHSTLSALTGLFVATTLVDGNYYYTVTVSKNGTENVVFVPGANTLLNPVSETVSKPQPLFQQSREISYATVEIYTLFTSMKYAVDKPLMNKAGFVANDFALNRNNDTGNQPLRLKFHAGGTDFLSIGLTSLGNEMVLNPEDYFPAGNNSAYWGSNENYDIYNNENNETPPVSGTDYNYTHQALNLILDWAVSNLTIDSNRIYLDGSSFGSIGAFFFAMTYPERIAAIKLSVGCFNLAFQNDSNQVCTLNAGNGNRTTGDQRMGTVSSNLATNLGYPVYSMLNGGWLANHFNSKNYPVIYSINGKRDTLVGWTEKTMFYDSVNAAHLGGYYFYDNRTHGGTGSTWSDNNFDLFRYRKNNSYPAFSDCSANEDFGNGSAESGAPFGSINGFLDWKDQITDETSKWETTVFLRDLKESSGAIYPAPSSCTVSITPRRLQQFKVTAGDALAWTITHGNQVVQSGNLYYTGGLITIPDITVFKDAVKFSLINQTLQDSIGFTTSSIIVYPNPFAFSTNIRWELPSSGKCSVKIYDVQGRWISTLADGEQSEGIHQVTWNAENPGGAPVTTGVYLVRLETGTNSETKKIIVQR